MIVAIVAYDNHNSYLPKRIFQVINFTHGNNNKEKVITKMHTSDQSPNLCLDLLLQDVLEGDGVSGELGDTLTELLDGHGLLVEVEAEESLVVDVGLLGDVEAGGVGGVELLGDGGGGVVEVLEEVGLFLD